MLPRPKSGVSYESWQEAHKGDQYELSIIAHANCYAPYVLDNVKTPAYVNDVQTWTDGALRPLWPERCYGVSELGSSCSACSWLGGTLSGAAYNTSLNFVQAPRSTLVRKLERITSGRQGEEAASCPTRGLHRNHVDTAVQARLEHEALQQQNALLLSESVMMHTSLQDTSRALSETDSALHHVGGLFTKTVGTLNSTSDSLQLVESRLEHTEAIVTYLSAENQVAEEDAMRQ